MTTRLARQLQRSVVIQGSGAAAMLLAMILLGRILGPEQQGRLSQIKSLIEFGAALSMLGMPQALYLFVQRGALPLDVAGRVAKGLAWVGLPVGLLVGWWTWPGAGDWPIWGLAGIAVAAATWHGLWRGLCLIAPSTTLFNLLTALPQWSLLILAGVAIALGGGSPLFWWVGLVAVWGLTCAAVLVVSQGLVPPDESGPVPWLASSRELVAHGLSIWLTTSMATAAIVVMQVAVIGAVGVSGWGLFSLALLLAQIPLTPLNHVVPILLRHRASTAGSSSLRGLVPWVSLPMIMLGGVVAVLGMAGWSSVGLGSGYDGIHRLATWTLVAGAAEAAMRLAAVDAQVVGRAPRMAVAEGVRLALLVAGAGWGGWLGAPDALEGLARWWALASITAVIPLWAGWGAHGSR